MKTKLNHKPLLPLLALATMSQVAVAEDVQTPSIRALEEVIVTARRTKESLLDVPVTVSSLSEQAIKDYNLDSMEKLAQSLPQVKIVKSATGGGSAIFSIRGIGTSPLDSGFPQSVSINIDDVPGNQGYLINLGFFDLDRVEVLKGPQALFFGKNSPAGVISFTSKGPGDVLEGYIKTSYEFEADETIVEGAVGGPLTDTLGVRVAARYRDMDGYTTNVAQGFTDPLYGLEIPNPDDKKDPIEQDKLLRLTAVWEPTDDFTATMKLLAQDYDSNGDQQLSTQLACAPGQTVPTTSGLPDPFQSCKFSKKHSQGRLPDWAVTGIPHLKDGGEHFTQQETYLGSLKLDYSLEYYDIAAITSFTKYDHLPLANSSGASYWYFAGLNEEQYNAWSQEFRINSHYDGPLNFVAGAFYERTDLTTNGYRTIGPVPSVNFALYPDPSAFSWIPDPVTGRYFDLHSRQYLDGETLSFYAQARYEISDNMELAAGARYTEDEKFVNMGNDWVNPISAVLFPALPAGERRKGTFTDYNVSPEVTLTYHVNDDLMVYAAYKTGYKGGGFGLPTVVTQTTTLDGTQIDSETSKGGEIGMKGEFFDNSMRVQTTVYSYKFEDLQSAAFDAATTSFRFSNAGSARTEGIEMDLEWAATGQLTLRGSASYNHGRYLSFDEAYCYAGQAAPECSDPALGRFQDLKGERLPQASDWTASLGFTYEQPIASDYLLVFYSDANYRSKYNISDINIPGAEVDGYTLVNAGVRFGPEVGNWELAFYGRNLTDKFLPTYGVDKPGGVPGELYSLGVTRPREYALEATYRF